MNDLTLLNSDLDLDLTLLDDEAFTADLVAFAEKLEQQWHELLAEQSTLLALL
ncbi:hypothetical protein KAM398_09080 [Acinetobacter sp. KAM398]|uniref:hypothetical protein n=1 Tax=unclassified Acinetobacter TaxID=196816 RepID=UPI001F2F118A|nr:MULTISPECIES: hypothetical protein [unclassified Acinetobacter]GJC30775.1 hypothetical protein KAM392_07540 [Acinetobacter sp. KAM392]GJC33584.1 hypothetical protein KAM393_07530 [Acinetobacter sp. KAM393]GJC36413.1 hypothetical protein KAM394_07530 [Acinetobacter sp. KAM394]GJC39232.1 hypothetical protein KAM395_07530 [Acinetobacter sp. KAM395]GJC42339.1 hypothetical protein KAM396_10360 [Acinetobacter sp. KAM396]